MVSMTKGSVCVVVIFVVWTDSSSRKDKFG